MTIDLTNVIDFPPHYTSHPSGIEPREITQYMGFPLGCAFKYLFRRDRKDTLETNLLKAITYLEFELQKRQSGSILIKKNDESYWKIIESCEKKLEKIVQCERGGYGEILRSIWDVEFVLEGSVSVEAIRVIIKKLNRKCKRV